MFASLDAIKARKAKSSTGNLSLLASSRIRRLDQYCSTLLILHSSITIDAAINLRTLTLRRLIFMYTRISRVVIGSTIGFISTIRTGSPSPSFSSRTPFSHSRNLSILHMWSQVARVQAGLRKKKNGEDKEGIPERRTGKEAD